MSLFSASRYLSWRSRLLLTLIVGGSTFGLFQLWNNRSSPIREHLAQGMELMRKGQFEAAENQGRIVIQLDSHNAQAWDIVGQSLFQKHDYKAARAAFEETFRATPDIPGIRVRLAACALATRDINSARLFAKEELKRNPDSLVALGLLEEIERRSGQSEARVSYLKRLSELQPQNAQALSVLIDALGERHEYDQVLPLAERLVSLQPEASSYFLRAIALYNANPDAQVIDRAKADFQKALELDLNFVEAHRFLGRIALQQNQPREAIAHFEMISQGRPYASAHFLELATAYRQAGDSKRAKELQTLFSRLNDFNLGVLNLEKAIELHPTTTKNYRELGILLLQGIESNEHFFQLYRFRFLNREWQSIDYYLGKAGAGLRQDAQSQVLLHRCNVLYQRHLRMGLEALKHRDKKAAQSNLARAVLLRAGDARTQQAVKQCIARGFTPLGSVPPYDSNN